MMSLFKSFSLLSSRVNGIKNREEVSQNTKPATHINGYIYTHIYTHSTHIHTFHYSSEKQLKDHFSLQKFSSNG